MDHRGGRPDTHLARHIEAQYGAFTRDQARRAGFTDRMIERRVTDGRWAVLGRGVYRPAGIPESCEQRLLAACIAGPAVVSHRSAAGIWGFPGMTQEIVEVTALRHRRRHTEGVIWHESYHLSPKDVTSLRRIPLTRPVLVFRLDFAYVAERIAIELDGSAWHSPDPARTRDRSRDNALAAIRWFVLRFGWSDVEERPDTVVATLRAALKLPA